MQKLLYIRSTCVNRQISQSPLFRRDKCQTKIKRNECYKVVNRLKLKSVMKLWNTKKSHEIQYRVDTSIIKIGPLEFRTNEQSPVTQWIIENMNQLCKLSIGLMTPSRPIVINSSVKILLVRLNFRCSFYNKLCKNVEHSYCILFGTPCKLIHHLCWSKFHWFRLMQKYGRIIVTCALILRWSMYWSSFAKT
jgi:hypothetical protein